MSSRNDARVPRPQTGGCQSVAIGAASARTAAGNSTNRIILSCDVECHVAFGGSAVVATTSDTHVPANANPFFRINEGEYIAVIRGGSTDGTLKASAMTY